MAARSPRAVETRRKKNNHRIDRPKQSRIQGNTSGVRTKMRKMALIKAGRGETGAEA